MCSARVVGAIQGAEIRLSERAKEDVDNLRAKRHADLKWTRHDGVEMKGFSGRFTGAPDNHMLTVYSPGPVNHQYTHLPQLDGGIYLIKDGAVVEEPAQMLLIKNDPQYNESWPRALVPYKRIYGIAEPKRLIQLANDGSLSKDLPRGTPFGLVGTSSLCKRESYPN